MPDRPFSQRIHDISKLKLPSLSGYAYKFTLFLPLTKGSKQIFSTDSRDQLRRLLVDNFGGVTYSRDVVHPLLRGEWEDDEGNVITNEHAKYEVYSQPNEICERYFRELKKNLQTFSGEADILVEKTTVELLESS